MLRCMFLSCSVERSRWIRPPLRTRPERQVGEEIKGDFPLVVPEVLRHIRHLDDWSAGSEWWDLLVEAAELMWLADTATWCRWRRWESIHGIIRAQLTLVPVADGGRRSPIPGKGVLRPLWHIG